MMKTSNGKGEVKIPFAKLIGIFLSDAYKNFKNASVKAYGKDKIFDFIFAAYQHQELNLDEDIASIFVPILNALPGLEDNSQEKCVLINVFLHRIYSYMKNNEIRPVLNLIKEQFVSGKLAEEKMEIDNKVTNHFALELLSSLYIFICVFQHPENIQGNYLMAKTHIEGGLQFMHNQFKGQSKGMDYTWSDCVTSCLKIALMLSQDRDLYTNDQQIPILLIMSQSQYGNLKDEANISLKSYLQEFDRNDTKLVENVYQLLKNNNIYKQEQQALVFKEHIPDSPVECIICFHPMQGDRHTGLSCGHSTFHNKCIEQSLRSKAECPICRKEIPPHVDLPVLTRKAIIDFLIKFECSVRSEQMQSFELVEKCIEEGADFLAYALKFISHMITNNSDIYSGTNTDGFSAFQRIKYLLVKIRNLQDLDEEDVIVQLSKSEIYGCLADLAKYNYIAIFNKDLNISQLIIEAFEKLISRAQDINKIKPIREDDQCLILMQALNKYRDIIETNLNNQEFEPNTNKTIGEIVNQEKNIILIQVSQHLNKELLNMKDSNPSQNELIYLCFLYLSSLDKHTDPSTKLQIPNPKTLIFSIQLQEHADIKIQKEALKQIDMFNQLKQQSILASLIQEVKLYFKRHEFYLFNWSEDELRNNLHYLQGTAYQSKHYTPAFISQTLEISRFTMKFFDQEKEQTEEINEAIQRQLLMNLNLNFFNVKSDFVEPLQLIKTYFEQTNSNDFSVMIRIGAPILYKVLQKTNNIDQNIMVAKILKQIISKMDGSQKVEFIGLSNIQQSIQQSTENQKISHEAKMVLIIQYGVQRMLDQNTNLQWICDQIDVIKDKPLSPNLQEQIRLTSVIVGLLNYTQPSPIFYQCSELILDKLSNSTISTNPKLRISLIESLSDIVEAINKEQIQNCILQVLLLHYNKDISGADCQPAVGKMLVKAVDKIDGIEKYTNDLIINMTKSRITSIDWKFKQENEEMKSDNGEDVMKDETIEQIGVFKVTLTSRRNCVIYLNEILQHLGETNIFIKEKYVEIQKIFLKYIFDKKPVICDISSKALTTIYQTGSTEVKNMLVESLSNTLTGNQNKAGELEKEYDDEDKELNLDFNDQTSSDQRRKLKTYKDLCKIANDIGHQELVYQFMEVHRHLTHYQDMNKAAKGLSNIIMLDDRLKKDLLKITPKILMLTYDFNEDVRNTMRELWACLIDVDQEQKTIDEKWQEILKEALSYMKMKEFRKRLSACLLLLDLLPNRTWCDVKDNFKELFLNTLTLFDDDIEAVKKVAYNLAKTNKTLIMKFANIYSNEDIKELEEVLQLIIPLVITEVIPSTIQDVRFYGVNILFEIVKSSTQEKMYQSLQIKNKYERQIAFNYNSENKMKEILNVYLDRIILEVIGNLSQMNSAVEQINRIEQYAIDQGVYSNQGPGNSKQISESQINDMRIKYTKDSEWGEILNICRKQMNQSTFDKIIQELMSLMVKGHDQITKSSAINFIMDIILENKTELISPQNSKKIAQKIIDLYSQNSIKTCLDQKQSMVNLYASCLGLQFKILQAYPQTMQSLIQQVTELPEELEVIKSINLYEIIKNLPENIIRTGGQNESLLVANAIPMFYINQYKTKDQQLKKLSVRVLQIIKEAMTENEDEKINFNVELIHSEKIFQKIDQMFDSNNYDERISAAMAMEDLCSLMQPFDLGSSQQVQINITKMFTLINNKYFNNKELFITSFIRIMNLMEQNSPWSISKEFQSNFLEMCEKQIVKFGNSNQGYKNKVIECLNAFLKMQNSVENLDLSKLSLIIKEQTLQNLDNISQQSNMMDTDKFTSFDEKKEEDKQQLQAVNFSTEYFSLCWTQIEFKSEILEMFKNYYSRSNFLVRSYVLAYLNKVISEQSQIKEILPLIQFILAHTAKCGEKYDINLEKLSQICLIMSSFEYLGQYEEQVHRDIMCIVEIFVDKGGDSLVKNIDVVRRNISEQK